MTRLAQDRAGVRVPATSANLGPGFDSFGLALDLLDELEVRAVTGATRVLVEGQGAGTVPDGEDHLVIRALRAGLEHAGAPQAGLELRCVNRIPHGRGLGSSAAATVAGLLLARGLVSEPEALDDAAVLTLATEFEGHADNAAPALLGGATIAWLNGTAPRAVRIDVHPEIEPVVLVPHATLATTTARGALPATVPHADAAFVAGRAGLLVHALAHRPDLLLDATADRLHQDYRAAVMPETIGLVNDLRELGAAAVVSGAGPSVLVLGGFTPACAAAVGPDWRVRRPGVAATGGALLR